MKKAATEIIVSAMRFSRHFTAQSIIRHAIMVLISGTALYTKSLGVPTPFAIPLSFLP
jgi:hypothetical protein